MSQNHLLSGGLQVAKLAGALVLASGLFGCTGDPVGQSSSSTSSMQTTPSSSSQQVVSSSSLPRSSSSAPVIASSSSVTVSSSGNTTGSLLSDGTFTNGGASFTAQGNPSFNGMADFTINTVSMNPWDVELLHAVSVTPGQYTLCFDAKSDEASRMIWVGMDEGPTAYASIIGGDEIVSISTQFQRFKYTWDVNVTDSTARVQFKMGQSDVDVQLDNIGLYRGTECGGSAPMSSSSAQSSAPASGDADRGETLFFGSAQCVGCHTELNDGSGAFATLDVNNLGADEVQSLGLVGYIYMRMPPVNARTLCDEQCARDIVAFLNRYKQENYDPNAGVGDPAHIEGKRLFEAQCQTCHVDAGAELTTGIFSEEKLREEGIYRQSQLADFITRAMPIPTASQCDADCADKVAAYIITWHVLPIDPALADDQRPGQQDKAASAQLCSNPSARGFGNRKLKLLTNEEYANTLRDLFGYNEDLSYLLPVDGQKGSFVSNSSVIIQSSVEYDGLMQAAEKVAEWAANSNFSALGCSGANQSCADRLINTMAPRIFRRALTDAEKTAYAEVASGARSGNQVGTGIRVALGAMLSSPQFLYRHEIGDLNNSLGNGAYELSSYEIATFLSYSFTRSTPTGELWQAAQNDALRNPTRILEEARKLLSTDAAGRIMESLVHDWLATDNVSKAAKSAELFGDNYRQVTEDMVTELSLVFKDVMLNANGTFGDLYLPGSTYVNNNLANHYGLPAPGGNGFTKVNAADRGGVLLSGAFLAYRGDLEEASPIRRAAYVRRNMLCQYMPPPPPGVNVDRDNKAGELGAFLEDDRTTNRMAFHRLTEGPTCLECHAELINPLGFGLEDYDTMGRLRTVDNHGNPINAKGRLYSPTYGLQFYGDPERDTTYHAFEGGQELAYMLAEGEASQMAKACLAMQMYNYTTGILVDSIIDADSPSAENLSTDERNGYNCDVQDMVNVLDTDSPRAMLESMGTLDSIRYRKAWAR